MTPLDVNFHKTALVLIDLQKGIVASSNGQEVVEKAARLVRLFLEKSGFIAFVHVDFHDGADRLRPATDQPVQVVQPPRLSSNIHHGCDEDLQPGGARGSCNYIFPRIG